MNLKGGETTKLTFNMVVSGPTVVIDDDFGAPAYEVQADPQIGREIDSRQIDETPVLGRKFSSIPLLNSAFRQGKGTGDLFVNQTYVVTGVGSRRATTFTFDGANNDEVGAGKRL